MRKARIDGWWWLVLACVLVALGGAMVALSVVLYFFAM